MLRVAYKVNVLLDPMFAPSDLSVCPKGVNYKTGLTIKPHQVLTMSTGQIDTATYYCHSDGTTHNDPIVKVEFVWERAGADFALAKRIATVHWALMGKDKNGDTTWGEDTKEMVKFYDVRTGALADQRRRRNIVDQMISQVGSFGVLSYVQTMLRSLDDELNAYINTNDRTLPTKIGTYSGAWLDTDASVPLGYPAGTLTLRAAIIGSLDYQDS